jgi:hypothetical protein
MIQAGNCKMANLLWKSLEDIYENKGHLTIIAIMCNLFHTIAAKGADIGSHLTQLKVHWERLNSIGDDEIKLSDFIFKILILSSLPRSWDSYCEPFVGGHIGIRDSNPNKQLTSQQFIGILCKEYARRERCNANSDVNEYYSSVLVWL